MSIKVSVIRGNHALLAVKHKISSSQFNDKIINIKHNCGGIGRLFFNYPCFFCMTM